ncbi:hypothetical protein [Paenibacillus koleovorans]|uniref:hypothetical protein n=1 Tax=Paenibacillus koleovorans TaxID=121608 RepID=UPI000FDB067F|nr:hypothetical protein [Paenibacillus koleovorans]
MLAQVSFRESLVQLSFGQSSEQLGYVFQTVARGQLTEEPINVVRHLDKEFSIRMDLMDMEPPVKDQLLTQIRTEGSVESRLVPDSQGAVLRLTGMADTFQVRIGDLPPIRVTRAEPLDITLDLSAMQRPVLALFGPLETVGSARTVLLSEHETQMVLVFSEDMNRAFPINRELTGEWLDNRRFRIDLRRPPQPQVPERIETEIDLTTFRSLRGNYTAAHDWGLKLFQVREGEWRDVVSGERMGWSPRDLFYETIAFAPDGKKYVGAVRVGMPEGDGIGLYYAFVLEEEGKAPIVIENALFTNFTQQGVPIQWLDNDRLLYGSSNQLYVYSIGKGKRTTVSGLENLGKDGTWLHAAAADAYRGLLHILTGSYESVNGDERVVIHVYTYRDGQEKPLEVRKRWANVPIHQSRIGYLLSVVPVENGLFRTLINDAEQMVTRYEDMQGAVVELPGFVQYADNEIVYLLENVPGMAGAPPFQRLWTWRYGSETDLVQLPASSGWMQMVGRLPVAVTEQGFERYDADTNSWVPWVSPELGPILAVSAQTRKGMYKVGGVDS